MSEAQDPNRRDERDRPTGESSPAGRRAGRKFIPLAFVAGIVVVFLFMFLVSQCGTGDDGEVYGSGVATDVPAATPVATG